MIVIAGQSGWAAGDCDSPPESWQPRSAVQALAERNGWQVERLKIDDGCYEIKGLDAEGRPFKAKIDPATLQVVHIRRGEHDVRDRERERQREWRADPRPERPKSSSSGVHE
jgi:hypothetical protein